MSGFFAKFWRFRSREEYGICRSRQALSNAYLDAKIGVDTAENEPSKVWGMTDRFQKLDFRSQSWVGLRVTESAAAAKSSAKNDERKH